MPRSAATASEAPPVIRLPPSSSAPPIFPEDAQVTGNVFGVAANGQAMPFGSSTTAIRVLGSKRPVIGDSYPAAANTIGNVTNGIVITGGFRDQVLGNFIGTDAGGVDQGAGMSLGVLASGSADHTIGGTTAASEKRGARMAPRMRSGFLSPTSTGSRSAETGGFPTDPSPMTSSSISARTVPATPAHRGRGVAGAPVTRGRRQRRSAAPPFRARSSTST